MVVRLRTALARKAVASAALSLAGRPVTARPARKRPSGAMAITDATKPNCGVNGPIFALQVRQQTLLQRVCALHQEIAWGKLHMGLL